MIKGNQLIEKANSAIMNNKTKIVMIGMSYAQEWIFFINDQIEIVNKGIKGDITDNMVKRFREDVIDLHPDYVIIWGFSNDIITGDRAKIDQIIQQIQDNFDKMIHMSFNHAITPILATQLTISYKKNLREFVAFLFGLASRKVSYQDHTNSIIRRVNTWLRDLARKYGILLLDLEPILSNRRGFRKLKYARKDGSHITRAGYKRLTEFTIPLLTNYILKQESLVE